MNVRPKYKTKQKEILLSYLESVPGVHFTANDVCCHFKSQGAEIGQSTVYRQLESLVDHEQEGVCFHCKCEKCGKLIHLHCEELEEVRKHLNKDHGFKVDIIRTVFYGICEDCAAEA